MNQSGVSGKLIQVGYHLVFWMLSLGFFWILFSRYNDDASNTALFIAILAPVAVCTTYFFNYNLIPRFLVAGKYFRFAWYGVLAGVIGLWLTLLGGMLIWAWRAKFDLNNVSLMTMDVPMLVAALFFVVFVGISLKLIRINSQVQKQKDNIEKQRLMLDNQLKLNELRFLKEQLNPHFLFNTLNNLYGLTLEKSDKAPDLVMRLSGILDYMLYRTDASMVPLKQEVKLIEDYLTIEQHRFENRYPIRFEVSGNISGVVVAPLLFLPLVENCFKHGIRKATEDSFIEIRLDASGNCIKFTTVNSLSDKEEKGGIGIINLQKRLEMIYPDKHSLTLSHKEANFEALLTLEITRL